MLQKRSEQSTSARVMLSIFIGKRSWNKVQKALSFNRDLAKPCISPCCPHCSKPHSPLLLACKLNPPLEVIDSLLEANPMAVFEIDCEKKTPLHLACEYGAAPAVIKRIVQANKDATIERDIYGMLPIHRVCESYLDRVDSHLSDEDAEYCLMEVVQGLLGVHPDAILIEDYKEMNPIEYALEAELNLAIIQILQKASERQHNKKVSEQYGNMMNDNFMYNSRISV